ncbi:MAG: pre-peptidase C-terminal domain-containing protein [Planctomycetales bacterium]|nr:pre-peptidase C-terminal domain-containing protein [Planctomycetales bacterium]
MRSWILATVAAIVAAMASSTYADLPTITQLDPPGFQRGTECLLVISGARLDDTTQLLFYDPGVEVIELKAESGSKVVARLRIAADNLPGLHAMRLATATGVSNLRYFGVSPLPEATEVEPNSDFATPQPIDLNTTINGVIKTEDVDYYQVELAKGQKVNIEVEGLRLGTEFFDPFVAILDLQRFELARSDDAPLVQQDCVCSFIAPEAGKYIVEVRESSFGGNDRCQYRMHIGDFPRPLSITPSGGRPGEKIAATIVDASGERWQETIQLPDQAGDFPFVATRDGKSAPSPNLLRVVDLPNIIESEPDSDHAALVAVDCPVAFNGVLQSPGDVDWFKIKAKKDQQLELEVFARRVLRSPVDSWLEIHKVGGGRLATNDDAGSPDSLQAFKVPEDGEYLVAVRDQLNEGSPNHAYRIEIRSPEPSLRLTIDELQRYVSQTVEVPRGGQMAVLLRAARKNFSGDLILRMEDPLPGIELTTPSVPANASYIPMMIKAAADAPIGAQLATLIAETPPGGAGVAGKLDQRTMLVRGQNNRDMWGHDAQRLTLAVTKELPFSIEVVQPQVPLVRDGTAEFIVKAHRHEGYNERIYLRSLVNPGGVSVSGSIRIEPDQTEARIPVTANSKAAIGSFPITVLARAKSMNANVWVASEFVTQDVADSFFDFKFGKTVAELGGSGVIAVGLEVKAPPEGDVQFELVGLPAGVTCEHPTVKWTPELQQLSYPIAIAADARAGLFKTIYIKASITRPGGVIMQNAGQGQLQLSPPMANSVAAAPAASAPATATEKPLSRLEQLRQAKLLLQESQP